MMPERRVEVGRWIDPGISMLSGEGAGQKVHPEKHPQVSGIPLWEHLPSAPSEGERPHYYDRPAIKEPVWIWTIPTYFYVGGVAGGSAILAAALQTGRVGEDHALSRFLGRCRLMAAAGSVLSAGLLISDLGKPSRFLNMLRVFRPTSPMSAGSWILAATGGASAAAMALPRLGLPALGRLAGYASGLLGVPLAGYTGVLLSNSAVPVWQGARKTLPALFTASSVASVASLFELMPSQKSEERTVRLISRVGKGAELATIAAMEREISHEPEVGASLKEGAGGLLWKAGKGLAAAGFLMTLLPGSGRKKRIAAGLLGTAGALAVRFALFEAGKASSRNPQAVFGPQQREQRSEAVRLTEGGQ